MIHRNQQWISTCESLLLLNQDIVSISIRDKKTMIHMTTNGLGVRIIANIKSVFFGERKKRMFGFKRLEFDAFKDKKDSLSDEYI